MLLRVPHIEGTRFTVVGAARSGVAAARLLHRHGAKVYVSELQPRTVMNETALSRDMHGIDAEFGGHSDRALEADILVLSPGVSTGSALVRKAVDARIELVSEIEVASWFCALPIVAVTGTNGKSTTTALAGSMFRDAGWNTVVAGNIGLAFSDVIGSLPDHGIVVLEVSSFQLDHIHLFHPRVAILTNITPDHLDRYDATMQNYIDSKKRIWMNQSPEDLVIYSADCATSETAVKDVVIPRRLPCSTSRALTEGGWIQDGRLRIGLNGATYGLAATAEMQLKGEHNYANTLMAALACRFMGVGADTITVTCRTFAGVEHRLEKVTEINGVQFINDSKATNPESVVIALRSFRIPVILIAGGRDKGTGYESMIPLVRERVKHIILIGEAADRMDETFGADVRTSRAGSLEEATLRAFALATPGEVVLLSPACASFDMFENFEHRGRVFKEAVAKLLVRAEES